MKKQLSCFGCGKALTVPKAEPKNLVRFLKGSCDPTWSKFAFVLPYLYKTNSRR